MTTTSLRLVYVLVLDANVHSLAYLQMYPEEQEILNVMMMMMMTFLGDLRVDVELMLTMEVPLALQDANN